MSRFAKKGAELAVSDTNGWTGMKRSSGTVLVTALLAGVFLLSLFQLENFDIWLHLKSAELNLQTKSVVKTDPFSAFAQGNLWINHSWFACILLYGVYRLAGVQGLIVLRGAMATLMVLLWIKTSIRSGARVERAVAASLLGYGCVRDWLHVRPVLFTFLFASLFSLVLAEFRRGRRQTLWVLPPLGMLWANMHAGVTTGWILIAAAMADYGCTWLWRRSRDAQRDFLRLGLCLVATFALAFVNPYGADSALYAFRISHAKVFMHNIQEWLPAWTGEYPLYWLTLVAGLALLIAVRCELRVSEVLLFALFAFLSLRTRRYIGMFGVVYAPILARHAEVWLASRRMSVCVRASARLAAAALIAFGALSWTAADRTHPFGTRLRKNWYPEKAVDFLLREHISGAIFNEYRWGGYLIWRAWPAVRVMMDGRNLVYGEALYKEWRHVAAGEPGWQDVLDTRHVRLMLIDYNRPKSFYDTRRWRLVYWDDVAMVWARAGGEYRELIRRHDCTLSNPETVLDHLSSATEAMKLSVALRQKLTEDPSCIVARENLARSLIRLGRYDEAVLQVHIVIGQEPRRSSAHALLGFCYYARGEFRKALSEYARAARLAPREALHYHGMGDCYRKLGRWGQAARSYRRAAKLNPRFAMTHLRLAEVYLRLGNASKAITEAQYYKRLRPNDAAAKLLLERCQAVGGRKVE